jgi:hypothetical protein
VGLYLMDIVPVPAARGARGRPPVQIALRYLVSTQAADTEESHRLLGDLVFAALENAEIEVEAIPPPLELWRSLGVAPRPALIVRTLLRKERPETKEPYVTRPAIVETVPTMSLHGIVMGPGDFPVMGARVEYPALKRSTRTDGQGKFRFATVPSTPSAKLLVTVKGTRLSVTADAPFETGEPVTIRLNEVER